MLRTKISITKKIEKKLIKASPGGDLLQGAAEAFSFYIYVKRATMKGDSVLIRDKSGNERLISFDDPMVVNNV